MTAEQYLLQAKKINFRIDCLVREVQRLKMLACTVSPLPFDRERVNGSPPGESSFARILEKISEMEEEINQEIDMLVKLQAQIRHVARTLRDPELEVILIYYYLDDLGWREIGDMLHMNERTARRKRDRALARLVLPEDAIEIHTF